jgi:nitroreductase
MEKPATVDHPVHDLIRRRWSPRAFEPRPLAQGQLRSLLEAARWAPSCFNEQPWSFLVARREDETTFARLLSCLVAKNQEWARDAAVLLLTVARTTFARNGKPNRHAWHDVGLAMAQLTLQATALGLVVHQMAGVRSEQAAREHGVPEGHEVVTAVAIGLPGDVARLPADLREAELAPRTRKAQAEIVFEGSWGRPAAP